MADTPSYVRLRAVGPRLSIRLDAPSPQSARETLADLLACIQVAERTLGITRETNPAERRSPTAVRRPSQRARSPPSRG